MKRNLTLLLPMLGAAILFLTAAGKGGAPWGYKGDIGPEHWGDLDPAYRLCKTGKRQSPIDITQSTLRKGSPLQFHYRGSSLNLVNNGHTIQQNYDPGSYVLYNGKRFDLKQFHFHRKSEHTFGGKHTAMEMHLVHASSRGELLVVGIMLKAGGKNTFLSKFWRHIPGQAGGAKKSAEVTIDVREVLPQNSEIYAYSGSLTTPPGTEGVNWFVFAQPQPISPLQVLRFHRLYPNGYRPVQPLNGRRVTLWKP